MITRKCFLYQIQLGIISQTFFLPCFLSIIKSKSSLCSRRDIFMKFSHFFQIVQWISVTYKICYNYFVKCDTKFDLISTNAETTHQRNGKDFLICFISQHKKDCKIFSQCPMLGFLPKLKNLNPPILHHLILLDNGRANLFLKVASFYFILNSNTIMFEFKLTVGNYIILSQLAHTYSSLQSTHDLMHQCALGYNIMHMHYAISLCLWHVSVVAHVQVPMG